MEVRQTLRPGQRGTLKLLARFGERLICVRYRYDASTQTRVTTVEIVVGSSNWKPREPAKAPAASTLAPPRRVKVRIAYDEWTLRHAARAAGGFWCPKDQAWDVPVEVAAKFGIVDRIIESS
jgi:hypothetical protein